VDALFRVPVLNLDIFGIDPANPRSTSRSNGRSLKRKLSCSAGEFSFSSRPLLKCIWLVVWNIWIIFPYIGNVIIPTDELHHFSEGFKPPTRYDFMINFMAKISRARFLPQNVPTFQAGLTVAVPTVPFELRLS